MAKGIGRGLTIIEEDDNVFEGDDVISGNAVATKAGFDDAALRLGVLEGAAGFGNPVQLADEMVFPIVSDEGSGTGIYLDERFLNRDAFFSPTGPVNDFLSGKLAQQVTTVEMVVKPSAVTGPVGARLSVPTHLSPNGGQTVHPSVAFIPEGWNGYTYWMAHTPYPGGNDDHEDPNIVAGNDGINWVVPAGLTNPIDDATGQPDYNSDVELKMGPNKTLYLFWRYYNVNNVGSEERLFFSSSTNGSAWSPKKEFYRSSDTTRRLVSPTLRFADNRWTMWAIDVAPSPNRMVRLRSETADPASAWSTPVVCNIGAMQAGKEPWHLSVIYHGGRYVALLNDCTIDVSGTNGDMIFMTSADGITWENSGGTVIPRNQSGEHSALYRATLIPAISEGVAGFRVWYSAWTQNPSVWNVYRTFISDKSPAGAAPKAAASGETSPSSAVAANGGFLSVPISFPAGRFSSPPAVSVDTDSTRLNIAISAVTATGFSFLMNNWTAAQVGTNAKLFWQATEK